MQSLQLNENASGTCGSNFWKVISKGILGKQGDEMKRRIFDAS
jgi:hypothetical protein